MPKPSPSIATAATVTATLFILSAWVPANAAEGPKLEGGMEVFQVAPSVRPRPDAVWKDAAGKQVTLEDFKDKVILVNFWATWCPPCIRELPSIDRLQASMAGDDFTVVAINIDRGGKPVANRLLRRLKLKNLDLFLDRENKTVRSFGVRSMPSTFIFDRQGREVGKLEGAAEWDEPEAVALVKYFIDNPGHADGLAKGK